MTDAPTRLGIAITRVFEAPRERVWCEWTEPEAFADWFGGRDCDVPLASVSMDVRPGGPWRATMFCDDGRREIRWGGEYQEVVPPERLLFTISDRLEEDAFELISVVLIDLGDSRTEMRFEQHGHMSAEQYERAGQGWSSFFDCIDERLAAG